MNCTLAVLGSFRLYWCPVCKHHLSPDVEGFFFKVHGQREDDDLILGGGGWKISEGINVPPPAML